MRRYDTPRSDTANERLHADHIRKGMRQGWQQTLNKGRAS